MSSYGFTASQVGGIIKVTDKVSNSARLSMTIPTDSLKRLSLRPTSMDIFSLYGKSDNKRQSQIASTQPEAQKLERPELLTRPSWADSIGSSGSDSDKTLCEKRSSVSSRFRKRASRILS